MNPWNTYKARIEARGATRRGGTVERAYGCLNAKVPSGLSFHQAVIDGEPRELSIINSDNLNQKTLLSLPGEDLPHGGLVKWADNYWLITEKDANNEIYTRAVMQQCNYLLKWIAEDGKIVERWCIVEDGTKYLIGEYGDKDFVVNRGDTRISMIMARDKYSIRLNRNNRFLIDDYASPTPLAYRLTKPFKLGHSFNGDGVLSFVLTECNTEDTDNFELHIANYYDHFPREPKEEREEKVLEKVIENAVKQEPYGKKEWL